MSVKSNEELDRWAPGRVVLSVPFKGSGPGAPGRIILQEGNDERYAVHWQNRQNGGCGNGGYGDSLADALHDFANRVRIEEVYARQRGDLLELEVRTDRTLEGFMATARFHMDLSKNGNSSLNLADASGVAGVIWDDWLFATLDDDTWCFESFNDWAVTGTYEQVSEVAFAYYLENGG